jgi:pimeloyl-ACP methyl ester carboxylesterase
MLRACALALSLCAAATLNWGAPAHAAPAAKTPAEQRLGHLTIRSVGSGPAVVLIPGLGSSTAVYDDLAAKIGGKHRLILVQVNGFAGAPAAASTDNLIPAAVDELASWLKANKIERPAVIGHSMGGLMGMMLAAKHPAAAGKLMIVDALPFYGMLFGASATPDTVRPVVEQMRAGLVSGAAPLDPPPHMSNTDAGKAKVAAWLKASDRKTVGEALVEDATTDVRGDLHKLANVPVTVVYAVSSAERKAMTDGLYREAYKALPKATLVGVTDSDHFVMLDQPGAFTSAVETFLK